MDQSGSRVTEGRTAIAVAPNGARRGKADHPAVPLSADEIAACAEQCMVAGASMIHVHVRSPDGGHSLDAATYREVVAAIRRRTGDGLVIQVTTEAVGIYSRQQQAALIRALKPEAASIALREIVPADDAGAAREFGDLLAWMRTERILPQIILYDAADCAKLEDLRARGIVPAADIPVLYVLGRYSAGQQSAPADLLAFLASGGHRPRHWSVCAFGAEEQACAVTGALLGGHPRIGFENNLHLPSGAVAPSNADLVRSLAQALTAMGRELETAAGLRRTLQALW